MEAFLLGILVMSPMIIWWLYTWNKARKVPVVKITPTDAQIRAYCNEEIDAMRTSISHSYLSGNMWHSSRHNE